ncbi:hypothetical protein PC118_g6846 [Phytophthora cactorum]|uniref:Uncharacterized protein n=1 Tax=Phytophthora cactorum TaxID=29920 RepID=A0A8T1G7C4_9STRA|nr:hypothetical protein PC118_g6846 [Phytophthora cactorum]
MQSTPEALIAKNHARQLADREKVLERSLPFSWPRFLTGLASLMLVFSDIFRGGLGVQKLETYYPVLHPDEVLGFGTSWNYSVFAATKEEAYSADIKANVWTYKFDSTSITWRAFGEYLEISAFPGCLFYTAQCPEATLNGDVAFRMIDGVVNGVANINKTHAPFTYNVLEGHFFSQAGALDIKPQAFVSYAVVQMRCVWIYALAWHVVVTMSTSSKQLHTTKWRNGVTGVPEFLLSAFSSVTLIAQYRSTAFRSAKILRMTQVPSNMGRGWEAAKYQYNYTHRGQGGVTLGGVVIDLKFLVCLLFLVAALWAVHDMWSQLWAYRHNNGKLSDTHCGLVVFTVFEIPDIEYQQCSKPYNRINTVIAILSGLDYFVGSNTAMHEYSPRQALFVVSISRKKKYDCVHGYQAKSSTLVGSFNIT